MKIVRFVSGGRMQYGVLESDHIVPCTGDPFVGLKREDGEIDAHTARLLPPVSPPNIICLGLNYKKHADEAGVKYPSEPLIFFKTTTSLCGPGDPIVLPKAYGDSIDYESEMAIVIGKQAKDIEEASVPEFVLGYTIANDVSNRAVQFKDGQWARGKSYDTFCPLGPCIETDIDPDHLAIECRVDGNVMQSSNTSNMIFSSRRIVAFLSTCMTLLPGSVILTGTPEGVGYARVPKFFLEAGQRVECTVEGIGTLANPVVGPV